MWQVLALYGDGQPYPVIGLIYQWNSAGWDFALLRKKGGGGGGGNSVNVKEEEVVRSAVMLPSAASAVMDLPSKLTSATQSNSHGARWWELQAMSLILFFSSFCPVMLQWLAM